MVLSAETKQRLDELIQRGAPESTPERAAEAPSKCADWRTPLTPHEKLIANLSPRIRALLS